VLHDIKTFKVLNIRDSCQI